AEKTVESINSRVAVVTITIPGVPKFLADDYRRFRGKGQRIRIGLWEENDRYMTRDEQAKLAGQPVIKSQSGNEAKVSGVMSYERHVMDQRRRCNQQIGARHH